MKSLRIIINQRSPVSRPMAYCEECAKKKPLSGHVNHIDVSTKAEWDEVVDLFGDDLCKHLEARLQPPVQEQKDKMETLDSSWDLAHEWESAQDYVQRMADKALTHYLAPAGVSPEEEGVCAVVSIESTSPHEWESAQDYVQRMADKALTHYLAPAGVSPEEEGVCAVVSIESTSQPKPGTVNELETLRGELQRAVRQRDAALWDLARLRAGTNL